MSLAIFSMVGAAIGLLLNQVVIPRLRNSSESKSDAIYRLVFISTLLQIKRICYAIAIVYGALWLVSESGTLFSKLNGEAAMKVVSLFASLDSLVGDTALIRNIIFLSAFLLIFLVVSRRRARAKGRKTQEALEALQKAGSLPAIEADAQFMALQSRASQDEETFVQARKEFEQNFGMDYHEALDTPFEKTDEIFQPLRLLRSLEKSKGHSTKALKEYDIQRRIIPTIEQERGIVEAPRSFLGKVRVFFTSKGTINTLRFGSRVFSILGLVLVLLSFVAATGNMIGSTFEGKAYKIAELELTKEKQQLDASWQQSLAAAGIQEESNSDEQAEWTAEDEQTLNQLARIYERSLGIVVGQQMYVKIAGNTRSEYRARARSIRGDIARQYTVSQEIARANAPDLGKVEFARTGELLPQTDPSSDFTKRFARMHEEAIASRGQAPLTDVGESYKRHLRERIDASPRSFWQSTKGKVKAYRGSFSVPATPKQVLGEVMNEAISSVTRMGFSPVGDNTIQGEVSSRLSRNVSQSTLKKVSDTQMARFTDELVRKADLESAVTSFEKTPLKADQFMVHRQAASIDLPNMKQMSASLEGYQPTITHEALTDAQKKTSVRSLSSLSRSMDRPVAEIADASLSFKGLFPGQVGMETSTVRAKLDPPSGRISRVTPKVGAPKVSTSVARARSFRMLRGSRRIGGVLIGLNAENSGSSAADFVDIDWNISGDQISISLKNSQGETKDAGTYDMDIVHHALAYAADGRPVAATMISATPIPFLKILVHPSLVNSQVGCEAIGLDRLVDTYASSNPKVKDALLTYNFEKNLYEYAVLKIILEGRDDFQSLLRLMSMQRGLEENWDQIYSLTGGRRIFTDTMISHIAARPEFYNSQITRAISRSMSSSFSTFDNALENAVSSISIYSYEDVFKCSTDLWSGVRERSFTVDGDLTFLKGKSNDPLFPLNFIEQVAYTPNEEAFSSPVEASPWVFPSLSRSNLINQIVNTEANRDRKHAMLLRRMRAFTLAQRLFRVILEGDLGDNLPVEKLADLMKETQSAVSIIATPTWNGYLTRAQINERPEIIEQILGEVDAGAKEQFIQLIEAQGVDDEKNLNPCN